MSEIFKWLVVVTLGVWTVILFALFLYLALVYLEPKKQRSRPPQVERDHTGRPLKERV